MNKKSIILAVVVLIAVIVYAAISGLFFNYGNSTHADKNNIADNEDEYTIQAEGFDEFNGLQMKLHYQSETTIGMREETASVIIENGKCVITGRINTIAPASWAIYEGDDTKAIGRFILEPGTFPLIYKGNGDFNLKGASYNDYAYTLWQTNPTYKKIVKNKDDFAATISKEDLKTSEIRTRYLSYLDSISSFKNKYFDSIYNTTKDPLAKLTVFYIGRGYWEDDGPAKVTELKSLLGDHYLIKTIEYFVKKNKENKAIKLSVDIGKVVKNFKANDLNGKEFELSTILIKNKYVLVEFWASWCSPCRAEIPNMKEAYKKYHAKGFEIVSFSLDEKRSMWEKASIKEKIPWVDISDLSGWESPVSKMYGVTGIPDNFLVDKKGKIIAKKLRGEKLDEKLEELLGE